MDKFLMLSLDTILTHIVWSTSISGWNLVYFEFAARVALSAAGVPPQLRLFVGRGQLFCFAPTLRHESPSETKIQILCAVTGSSLCRESFLHKIRKIKSKRDEVRAGVFTASRWASGPQSEQELPSTTTSSSSSSIPGQTIEDHHFLS
jgi:hypothetical protein